MKPAYKKATTTQNSSEDVTLLPVAINILKILRELEILTNKDLTARFSARNQPTQKNIIRAIAKANNTPAYKIIQSFRSLVSMSLITEKKTKILTN